MQPYFPFISYFNRLGAPAITDLKLKSSWQCSPLQDVYEHEAKQKNREHPTLCGIWPHDHSV